MGATLIRPPIGCRTAATCAPAPWTAVTPSNRADHNRAARHGRRRADSAGRRQRRRRGPRQRLRHCHFGGAKPLSIGLRSTKCQCPGGGAVGARAVSSVLLSGWREKAGDDSLWVTFAVDDVDAITARARELGGSVLAGPQNAPWVRFAILADPAGVLHRQPVRSGEPLDDPLSDIGDGINCQWRWSPWRRGTLS
jgi:Glyoxalase-like domain